MNWWIEFRSKRITSYHSGTIDHVNVSEHIFWSFILVYFLLVNAGRVPIWIHLFTVGSTHMQNGHILPKKDWPTDHKSVILCIHFFGSSRCSERQTYFSTSCPLRNNNVLSDNIGVVAKKGSMLLQFISNTQKILQTKSHSCSPIQIQQFPKVVMCRLIHC